MGRIRQDLRYAIRSFIHAPAFAAVVILTYALGIGVNTAIFSVINSVILRPLPYQEPERLMRIRGGSSAPDLADLFNRGRSLEKAAGYRDHFLDLTEDAVPQRINAALVTGDAFPLFQIRPVLGRYILPSDDLPNGPHVVLLGHNFWASHLASSKDIIGKRISFSGLAYTIIGVMPADFHLPQIEADVYAPIHVESNEEAQARGAHSLYGVVRLKKGISMDQAQQDFDRIAKDLAQLYPEENSDRRFILFPLHDYIIRNSRTSLLVLFGAVWLVLLIGATNVANLLLVRSGARRKEIAIRASLGATRRQLLCQLLVESVTLSIAGGALGLFGAWWFVDVLQSFHSGMIPSIQPSGLDLRVLLFTISISVLTGFVFGLMPAISGSRADLNEALKEQKAMVELPARRIFGRVLVVSQVTLSFLLLIGAGLLLRSFYSLQKVDPGFNSKDLLTMNFTLPLRNFADISRRTHFFREVALRVRAIPGVDSVGMTSELPFGTGAVFHNFIIQGRPPVPSGTEPEIYNRGINEDYFRTMQIPLRRGRFFSSQDDEHSPRVAIVNAAMVKRYFPGEDPIGKMLLWAREENGRPMTIVGVVGDIHSSSAESEEVPAIYTPYAQESQFWKTWMNVVIRTSAPKAVIPAVRQAVNHVDRTIPVADIFPMDVLISRSFADRRFMLILLGTFASLAVLLASIGIYGVISYLVNLRRHEVGVRLALGAKKEDILKLFLYSSIRVTVIGLIAGLGFSLIATRIMKNMLFGVSTIDPLTYIFVPVILCGVSLFASYIPTRRAMRVQPVDVLRYE